MAKVLVWRTAGDGMMCFDCRALEGKCDGDGWSNRLPPGQGGPPPMHPDCRCYLDEEEVVAPQDSG
jgi:hypothetical protein